MMKKIQLLFLFTLLSFPLIAQQSQSAARRQQALVEIAEAQKAQEKGDIYRGTVFGAEQKSYHGDTPGNRPTARKKYVYDTSLMRAVKLGDPDRVRTLLYANVDTNERNFAGITPLTVAAEKGNLEIVTLLVDNGKADVNLPSSYGVTPLIAAAAAGNTDVARYLVKKGADASVKDNTGKTPILYAISTNNPELIAALSSNNEAAVNLPDKTGNTPLIYAAQKGYLKQTKTLLANGANPDYRNLSSGLSALSSAAAEGNTDIIRALVQNGKANINLPDLNGRTPLMYAIEQNQPEAVRTLISLKANLNAQDNDGATALMRAAAKGDSNTVALLLKQKTINPSITDIQGRDAVFYSVFAPTTVTAQQLLPKNPASLNLVDNVGNTPLLAAIQAKNDKTALYFVQQGADLTATNQQGNTAFMLAPVYLPGSMTEKVLQVKQQAAYQKALQDQAAKLANVKELEQQLAEEEETVKQLQMQEEEQKAAEKRAEQERLQASYQEQIANDPEIVALQEQLKELKAKKAALLQQSYEAAEVTE